MLILDKTRPTPYKSHAVLKTKKPKDQKTKQLKARAVMHKTSKTSKKAISDQQTNQLTNISIHSCVARNLKLLYTQIYKYSKLQKSAPQGTGQNSCLTVNLPFCLLQQLILCPIDRHALKAGAPQQCSTVLDLQMTKVFLCFFPFFRASSAKQVGCFFHLQQRALP